MNAKRRPLIAGNWKMHAGGLDGVKLAMQVRAFEKDVPRVDLLVAPPYTAIAAAVFSATKASVSPKYCRRSLWPMMTHVAPASFSIVALISPVKAPCGLPWTFCAATRTRAPSSSCATAAIAV